MQLRRDKLIELRAKEFFGVNSRMVRALRVDQGQFNLLLNTEVVRGKKVVSTVIKHYKGKMQ